MTPPVNPPITLPHPLRGLLWLVLAIPAALMLRDVVTCDALPMKMYHPSGEMALRLMVLAMLPGPLSGIFRPNTLLRFWLAIRRNLGVAAFGYAALHLLFYVLDMQTLDAMLDEVALPAIWTGWLSFSLMLAAASISFDFAMRELGRQWKRIQQGLYAAVLLAAMHWWLLDRAAGPALLHLTPLALAWAGRAIVRRRRAATREQTA